jgi:DNA polymerase/3'-5' exonuclease PolX
MPLVSRWSKPIMSMDSGKLRWPADLARRIGDELVAALKPCCEQACIAGSLRRNKAEVGDIEILYVPRIGQIRRPGALFTEPGSLADDLLEQWLAAGVLAKRLNKNGRPVWGPLNKLARHSSSGISVDFFATTPNRWFVSLVMRTGSAAMNAELAGSGLGRGMKLHAYGVIERLATGELIVPQSEQEVFELLGMPYREPHER